MAFTATLGTALSRLANILLGMGARLRGRGTGAITIPAPTLAGTGTFTPPRYTRVRSTPAFSGGAGTASGSFASLPAAGDLIVVQATGNGATLNVVDNQGNTYHRATGTGPFFGWIADVWYAYNIGAPSGTFTVTVTGDAGTGVWGMAHQWTGFGTSDPLFATGFGGFAGGTFTVTASPSTLNPNALGVCSTVASNAAAATLVSGAPWAQDFNFGAFAGSGASELIKTAGAQSVAWDSSFGGHGTALAIFQDPADFSGTRATQTLESQIVAPTVTPRTTTIVEAEVVTFPVQPRATQIVLTILTRVPEAPPPAPGCPPVFTSAPVTGAPGCVPDLQ